MAVRKKQRSRTVRMIYTMTVISALVTLAILFYPDISDAWNRYVSSRLISEYTEDMAAGADYTEAVEAARQYNMALFEESRNNLSMYAYRLSGGQEDGGKVSGEVIVPDVLYESMISALGNQMMGYIDIPKINLSLPVYHYSSEEVLSKGIGHLYGSSLPVGGESAHCVLTGHSGLMKAKLFTDLKKVETGDVFTIHVLDLSLNYEVDQIKTVTPSEFNDLDIHEGKDEVTLITCSPYGINSHRLLVRGHRIADTAKPEEKTAVEQIREAAEFPFTVFAMSGTVLLLGVLLIRSIWKKG